MKKNSFQALEGDSVNSPIQSSTASQKGSVASVIDDAAYDPPGILKQDSTSESNEFMSPVDDILGLLQNIYDKRLKISAKDMQVIDNKIHDMKNRLINFFLCNDSNSTKKCLSSFPPPDAVPHPDNLSTKEWPYLPTNRARSTVLIKSKESKKFESADVFQMESQVNNLISKEKINATISSSTTTKNGDIVIRFDQKDDVKEIANKVENELGFQTQSRSLSLPKMTVSYVPKYISVENESLADMIVRSNPWLQEHVQNGETFEVLFTYVVRDWKSIVLRTSPKIRSEIILLGRALRIENRRCPVKDRFHVQQCGKCLGFGHKGRACLKNQCCSHCGGEHHFSACPVKTEKTSLLCSNCKKANANDTWCNKHSAHSRSCPLYAKQMKRLIEMTHWGTGPMPQMPHT